MQQGPTLFFGRDAQLKQLREVLGAAARAEGGLVFVEGDPGMGKTSLLRTLEERARSREELRDARFLRTTCPAFLGTQSPYEPFIEILRTLTQQDDERRAIAKLVVSVLKETGSDWLAVIPGAGPAVGAALKTATLIGKHLLDLDDEGRAESSKVLAAQYTSVIATVSQKYAPLVLIVEDAHWIDSASCELLLRLAQRASDLPLVVLVTFAPSFLAAETPLQQIKATLQRSLLAKVVPLSGWDQGEIERYVQARYGSGVHPRLAPWLAQLTEGSPVFVAETLTLLERDKVIQLAGNEWTFVGDLVDSVNGWELRGSIPDFTLPENLRAILEDRIGRLSQEDREMLALGAVQGQRFRSSILVEMLSRNEMDVLNRLGSIEHEHRIIRFYADDTSPDETFDVYAFEHGVMQQQFYEGMAEPIRARYHERVATILERMLREQAQPRRRLVLGVAYHYEKAHRRPQAARYYFQGAQSAYAEGAFNDAIALCERALEHARLLPEGVNENDRLRTEILLLALVASEVLWRGKPELYGRGTLPLGSLVDEAESAAIRTGDPALMAQARFLRGESLVATSSLALAETAMKEALEMARAANDPVLQFAMIPHLGNIMNSQNLGAGMALQYEGLKLYQDSLATSSANSSAVQQCYFRLQSFIGVGEFDRGNYGAAFQNLVPGIAGLKQQRAHAALPRMLNYLAQLSAAIGFYTQAEQLLQESLTYIDPALKSPWRGYNQALLGKVYLEAGQIDRAEEELLRGWEETRLTWTVDLVQHVRIYYAELLMDRRSRAHDPGQAEKLLRATIDESREAAVHTTEISARTLLARLALARGDTATAVDRSSEAVASALEKGPLPALRLEEVHFTHYEVMKAAGRGADASEALARAHDILQAKAQSLAEEDQRRAYLETVPLSREIVAAWSQPTQPVAPAPPA